MEPKKGDTIVVWFSCGAASAIAAKKTIEQYGDTCIVRVVNNTVHEEDSDNFRFLKDVQNWIGVKIEYAINPKYPNCSIIEVFEDRQYMSGIKGAPCTGELKKQARYIFEVNNKINWHVLGFTSDEQGRYDNFVKGERANTLPILIERGITKDMCFSLLKEANIKLPDMYLWGYANANCIGCVKATSPTYWNHVRRMHPEVFKARAEQSRRIGTKLVRVKGKRLFLDELPEDAKGRKMKITGVECGIFCEEKINAPAGDTADSQS